MSMTSLIGWNKLCLKYYNVGTGIEEKEPALPRLNSNSMAGLEVYILKEWPHSEIR